MSQALSTNRSRYLNRLLHFTSMLSVAGRLSLYVTQEMWLDLVRMRTLFSRLVLLLFNLWPVETVEGIVQKFSFIWLRKVVSLSRIVEYNANVCHFHWFNDYLKGTWEWLVQSSSTVQKIKWFLGSNWAVQVACNGEKSIKTWSGILNWL